MIKYLVDGHNLFWAILDSLGDNKGDSMLYGAKKLSLPNNKDLSASEMKESKWYIEIDDIIQVYLTEIRQEADKIDYGVLAKCDNDTIYFNVIDKVFYSHKGVLGESEKKRIEEFFWFFEAIIQEKGVEYKYVRNFSMETYTVLDEQFYIYTDDDDLSLLNIQNSVEQVIELKGRPFRICERPMVVLGQRANDLFWVTDGEKEYAGVVATERIETSYYLEDDSHSAEEVREVLKSNKKCMVKWLTFEKDKESIQIIDARPIKDTKIPEYELDDKMQQQNIEKLSTYVNQYKRDSFYECLEKITNDIAENEYQRGFIGTKENKESAINGWRGKKITQLKLYTDITDQMLNKMRHYEKKKSLYKKRVRVFLAYALVYGFSYDETRMCLELLNGGMDLTSINENLLLKLIECNICLEYEDRLDRIDKVLYKINPILSLRNLINKDDIYIM